MGFKYKKIGLPYSYQRSKYQVHNQMTCLSQPLRFKQDNLKILILISFLPQQFAHNLPVEVLMIIFHFVTSGIKLLMVRISPMTLFFTKVASNLKIGLSNIYPKVMIGVTDI